MIVKERDPAEHNANDPRSKAGAEAEEQMAFYLRRAFQERDDVLVFNDLRLVDDTGDAAQIDHLVMHRRGFVLIESKSISTEIRVNDREEWSHKWNGKWSGRASPVTQAKMQATLLKKLLNDNCEELRPKKLLGKLQFRYGACPFDILVAISDSGTIERGADIPELLKADQIPEQVSAIVTKHKKGFWKLTGDDGMEKFNDEEMALMAYFLKSRHTPIMPAAEPGAPSQHHCRDCNSTSVHVLHGRYGYYLKCLDCDGNTPIDFTCSQCGKKARIRKQREQFFRECRACGLSALYHVNA